MRREQAAAWVALGTVSLGALLVLVVLPICSVIGLVVAASWLA